MLEGGADEFRAHPFTLDRQPLGEFRIDIVVAGQKLAAPQFSCLAEISCLPTFQKRIHEHEIRRERRWVELNVTWR
ncbi:hypothetical protein [Roseibium aggregatum]|uniref:hypothetical protein n=1 Tax=Roseibium aggregatum TaxID=187304 RepID=UPI001E434526|nr:hypothetical protein [Roseibium aggregatum]